MKDKTIAILENRIGEQMADLVRKAVYQCDKPRVDGVVGGPQGDEWSSRALKNYCACQYCVAPDLKMLIYASVHAAFAPSRLVLGRARYVFQHPANLTVS